MHYISNHWGNTSWHDTKMGTILVQHCSDLWASHASARHYTECHKEREFSKSRICVNVITCRKVADLHWAPWGAAAGLAELVRLTPKPINNKYSQFVLLQTVISPLFLIFPCPQTKHWKLPAVEPDDSQSEDSLLERHCLSDECLFSVLWILTCRKRIPIVRQHSREGIKSPRNDYKLKRLDNT